MDFLFKKPKGLNLFAQVKRCFVLFLFFILDGFFFNNLDGLPH